MGLLSLRRACNRAPQLASQWSDNHRCRDCCGTYGNSNHGHRDSLRSECFKRLNDIGHFSQKLDNKPFNFYFTNDDTVTLSNDSTDCRSYGADDDRGSWSRYHSKWAGCVEVRGSAE